MKCPKCDGDLLLEEAEGHIGKLCSKCEGIFLTEKYQLSLKHTYDFDIEEFRRLLESCPKSTVYMCPICSRHLKATMISDVELDWCELCKGVYFDKSELKKAITKCKDVTKGEKAVSGTIDVFTMLGLLVGN